MHILQLFVLAIFIYSFLMLEKYNLSFVMALLLNFIVLVQGLLWIYIL